MMSLRKVLMISGEFRANDRGHTSDEGMNPADMRSADSYCPDLIVSVDIRRNVTFVNQAMADLVGVTASAIIGCGVDQLAALFGSNVVAAMQEAQCGRVAVRVQTRATVASIERWFDVWVVPRGADEVVCFARDVTDMKHTEELLRKSVGRDSLTGLLNHASFHEEVSKAVNSDAGQRGEVALVLFDLDYLKLINDVHGHQTGDHALREVAAILKATTREFDRIARLGGDEFGALFVGSQRDDVIQVAWRAVASVCGTVVPGVGRLSISAGVAFIASTREPGDLFDRADAAVYDAKASGRGVVSVADMTAIAYASRKRDVTESVPSLPPPELADARNVTAVARGALREWVHVLACSGGCVDLLDAEGASVKAASYFRFGHDDWKLAEQSYKLSDYPNTARALAQSQTYTCRVDDPQCDPGEAALLRERGFSSLLLTPLVSAGRSIGIIELFDTRPRVFTSADQRVAMALANHLAPLLAILQERGSYDALTDSLLA